MTSQTTKQKRNNEQLHNLIYTFTPSLKYHQPPRLLFQ